MKLSHELGKIFESEIEAIIQKEIDDPDFLAQENYSTCESRARDMWDHVSMKIVRVLALAICTHREKDHGEDHKKEIEEISENLTPEEIEVSTRGWWNL